MKKNKVWYVTGASQGLGLSLVKKLLDKGYRVAATSRNAQKLKEAVSLIDTDRFLPLTVDLDNIDCIHESVQQTIKAFGTIDVLVNNAGYGMVGIFEETTENDIRQIFDVNVLAVMNVVKAVIPIMRRQHSGYIINIGSVAGFVGAPGWSVYSASKAAIAAFSETLALDVKEFGITITVAEPSGFRTGFLTKNSLADIETGIDGYVAVKATRQRYLNADGKQPGDPARASEVLIRLAESDNRPLHLYLGKDAYKRAAVKLDEMKKELEQWKDATCSADFDEE